jgi:MFS family permease
MGHHQAPQVERTGLAEALSGRWLAGALLLAVATLRVVPALGVPLALAFLLDQQGRPKTEIGWSQSLFLLSGGLGTLVCPLLTRAGRELTALAWTTLLAAGCLLLLTRGDSFSYYAGLVGSGFLIQGGIPMLLAYSQRLLPRGRRLAASLTLGASWGVGGMIVATLQAYFTAAGRVEGMVWMMAPFALAGALGSLLLPRIPPHSLAAAPGTIIEATEPLILGDVLEN